MIIRTQDNKTSLFQLLPNSSLSWQQTKYVIGAVACISFAIALFWSLNGAWLVLPFAGLEVSLFSYVCYRVCLNSYQQERLSISDSAIKVEWGKDAPKQRWTFSRRNCEWVVIRPRHSLSPHQIKLKADKQFLPIGAKLNKDDIDQLIKYLESSNIPLRFTGETVRHAIEGFDI